MNTELNQIEIKENQIAVVTNSEGYPVGSTNITGRIPKIIFDDMTEICIIVSVTENKKSMQHEINAIYEIDGSPIETSYTVTITALY